MPELPEVETIVRGLRAAPARPPHRSVWWSGQPLHLARAGRRSRGLRAVGVGARDRAACGRVGKYILLGVDGGDAASASTSA